MQLSMRFVSLCAAVASLAVAAWLWGERQDEVAVKDASLALRDARVDVALREARSVGEGSVASGRAAVLRGQARVAMGDFPGARRDFELAVRERPSDWRARIDLARVLFALGDRSGARRHAERALELNPRAPLPPQFRLLPPAP